MKLCVCGEVLELPLRGGSFYAFALALHWRCISESIQYCCSVVALFTGLHLQ